MLYSQRVLSGLLEASYHAKLQKVFYLKLPLLERCSEDKLSLQQLLPKNNMVNPVLSISSKPFPPLSYSFAQQHHSDVVCRVL